MRKFVSFYQNCLVQPPNKTDTLKKENISPLGTNHLKLTSWKYSEYNSVLEMKL